MKTRKSAMSVMRGVVGAMAAVTSVSALAVPVTEWGFEINSGFTQYSSTTAPNNHTGINASNTNALLGAPSLALLGNSGAVVIFRWFGDQWQLYRKSFY